MIMMSKVFASNGDIVEFYSGYDSGETYNIGDVVPFSVDRNRVGSEAFCDDIYPCFDKDAWLIIKDSKIHDVIFGSDLSYDELYSKYDLIPFYERDDYSSNFTDEAWSVYQKKKSFVKNLMNFVIHWT